MKFCVKHRTGSGVIAEITIEAADRSGVFAELSRRGITAISVAEGEAKPAKRHSTKKSSGASGNLGKWCAGVAAALAIGAGVYLFLQSDMGQGDDVATKPKGKITSQTPAKAEKNGKADDLTNTAISQNDATPIAMDGSTNDVASAAPPKPKKKFRVIRKDEGKKKLFHNIADIYISRVVNSQPGNLIIGTINYDRFPEQFRKALEEPITIDKDDTPEEVAKKQAVIDTRAELKKMLDDGVDIAEVMREAEAESRRLWNYRRSLHLELAKAVKEGKFSANDMQDYVDAANMMLKDNGMEPMKYPQFWVRRMRQQEAEAASGN